MHNAGKCKQSRILNAISVKRRTVLLMFAMAAAALSLAAEPFAYVANYGNGTVSIIDAATNAIVGTIVVGNNPSYIAFTPDGKYAYVTNTNVAGPSGSVS